MEKLFIVFYISSQIKFYLGFVYTNFLPAYPHGIFKRS